MVVWQASTQSVHYIKIQVRPQVRQAPAAGFADPKMLYHGHEQVPAGIAVLTSPDERPRFDES